MSERKADGTAGITNKLSTSSGAYARTKDAAVTVYDGTNTRIVLGLLPDGSYGLIITKTGYNVADVFA